MGSSAIDYRVHQGQRLAASAEPGQPIRSACGMNKPFAHVGLLLGLIRRYNIGPNAVSVAGSAEAPVAAPTHNSQRLDAWGEVCSFVHLHPAYVAASTPSSCPYIVQQYVLTCCPE